MAYQNRLKTNISRSKAFLMLFGLVASLHLSSCNEDDPTLATLPSNLNVTVAEDTQTEGLVTVNATANNVNFYTITFTEDGENTVEENNTGEATYKYSSSGTYQIVVRAHATEDQFVQDVQVINISFADEPGSGGDFPSTGFSSPLSYTGYDLVWQDEFSGTTLSSDWNYEIGTGQSGWGNNELQYYLQENVTVADGVLEIEAKSQVFNASNYTSSRITTQNNQSFQYGRIDIRAALPYSQGLWPALWMLGDNISTVTWPACGEIDIMELVGGNATDNEVHGTIHWDDAGSAVNFGGSTSLSSGIFADEFHVFSIIWDDQSIKWLLDDTQYHEVDITPAELSEFNQKFFLIFNVAVGGNWPGSPNASTVFPQYMYVDYVRVFQKQ